MYDTDLFRIFHFGNSALIMVHLRLNEQESNPNPNVNFINALPDDNDDARQLLRALAAQVRPVMKIHGFVVNSLEEVCLCLCQRTPCACRFFSKLQYEYNQVFAGRNWNNGETVGGCCFGFVQWRRTKWFLFRTCPATSGRLILSHIMAHEHSLS